MIVSIYMYINQLFCMLAFIMEHSCTQWPQDDKRVCRSCVLPTFPQDPGLFFDFFLSFASHVPSATKPIEYTGKSRSQDSSTTFHSLLQATQMQRSPDWSIRQVIRAPSDPRVVETSASIWEIPRVEKTVDFVSLQHLQVDNPGHVSLAQFSGSMTVSRTEIHNSTPPKRVTSQSLLEMFAVVLRSFDERH